MNIAVLSDETAWLRWLIVHPDPDERPVWWKAGRQATGATDLRIVATAGAFDVPQHSQA
jgi:hypothetical protein